MQQLLSSFVFIAALLFVANPNDLFMPSMGQYVVAILVLVAAAVYVGLFLTDRGADEREVMLRAEAARMGYVAGIAVLTTALAYVLWDGRHPDPWILVALAAMVLTRLFVRILR